MTNSTLDKSAAANISLQRTAPCGLAAELGSFGALRVVFAVVALVACAASAAQKASITEISLQRTECFGTCPVYELVLRADGTATFHGGKNAQLPGDWTGKLKTQDFTELTGLVETIGFFGLKDHYEAPVTDSPMAITSVARGAVRKRISNYAASGPLALSGLEAAIDIVASRTEWEKVK
jgi:hypothetical protein